MLEVIPQSTTTWNVQVLTASHNNDTRDGKESEPSKNEPNQNPRFAKNRTEPKSKKCARTWTEPNLTRKEPNRTQTQMLWFLLGSFTEWNCKYIHTFHNKRGILLDL